MIVMENDGAVRALVGGKDYGESQFNRATHAYRQPGSSFKPYVYLTAFETGKYTPTTMVNGGGAACGHWAPKNFSAGEGNRMMLKDALAHSINTIAVKVSLDVGREKVLATMNKLGITRLKKTCSLALGDQGLTPLEHVTNYAVFASGGLEVHSYAIEEVRAVEKRVKAAGGRLHYNGIVPHAEGAQSGGIFFEDPDGIRLEIFTATGADELAAPHADGPTCGFF